MRTNKIEMFYILMWCDLNAKRIHNNVYDQCIQILIIILMNNFEN